MPCNKTCLHNQTLNLQNSAFLSDLNAERVEGVEGVNRRLIRRIRAPYSFFLLLLIHFYISVAVASLRTAVSSLARSSAILWSVERGEEAAEKEEAEKEEAEKVVENDYSS
jgi:hypothetical protein